MPISAARLTALIAKLDDAIDAAIDLQAQSLSDDSGSVVAANLETLQKQRDRYQEQLDALSGDQGGGGVIYVAQFGRPS